MNKTELESASEVLRALAHPVRLGTIELLASGEKTVTELYQSLECSQSVMSAQLNILKNQGLISTRREGNTKYCYLRNRDFLRLFNCLSSHIHNVLKIEL